MKGFTLAEVLVVVALVTIVAGFALVIPFDQYRIDSLRSERATLVAALQHVRAEAMSGVCVGGHCTEAAAHGLAVQNDRYVLFQGNDFASRDEEEDEPIDAISTMIHDGASEIAFAPFSGDAIEDGSITLTDATGKTATITVEADGRILWSD